MDDGFRGLTLWNTMTRRKEEFRPLDWRDTGTPEADRRVRMYVCGPTVYDFAHIGNARPVIVFDVLFRLLRQLYGADAVTYVRNITDVDDKINARAARDYPDLPLNAAIAAVTAKTAEQFHEDVAELGCLPPTVEPRATDYVAGRADGQDMVAMIATLIERGHAYQAGGEVLFDVTSMPDYGRLSNRKLDEQRAGARVAVDSHKRSPGDFVLWKLSAENEPGWDSPWGRGRPGWHIECSVMSGALLGEEFDIHGGGLDLIFPHHENEIAQSRCAHGTDTMAQIWMHNGYLQVEGRKMSKSDGNFVTIHDLLHTENFGGRKWAGPVLRLAMLMTHYREPIDFSVKRLEEAEAILTDWRRAVSTGVRQNRITGISDVDIQSAGSEITDALCNDLETYSVIQKLRGNLKWLFRRDAGGEPYSPDVTPLLAALRLLGFDHLIEAAIAEQNGISEEAVQTIIDERLDLLRAKNFAEADRIRDELLAEGIQLKDGKDPESGERITTWEVKR
ncbi:cysteine--tRNA ligase [Aurantimonas aggregata]|uniref:Cysteine--tRNA ligase n=1 Tax=Aurantimonas aggregata TaxID=2047720 RepID=A0A6L9MG35_9HYPH|nr:cysteine--tRNA ligase [Aurantimonas aggregata]NDV86661.1 cysteine--tRNA ligase [Aurantimonas aggregata]